MTMSIDNADNDTVFIPCDICGEVFSLEEYNNHYSTHMNNNQAIPSPSTVISTIPCEYPNCNIQVPFEEYESHRISHLDSSVNNQPIINNAIIAPVTAPVTAVISDEHKIDIFLIPCEFDGCNQSLLPAEYEEHQLLHISISTALDTNLNINEITNTTNTQDASFLGFDSDFQVIRCKFVDCEQQWIPMAEYEDHLQLHKLQKEIQSESTASDAMIALEQQLLNVQEFTSNNNRNVGNQSSVIHCTSNSFKHLHGSQYPCIPVCDSLQFSINNNFININNAMNRDLHGATGIIQALHLQFAKCPHMEYYLCDPLIFYYRGVEDYSWGCGFRNMQTLTSSLLQPMGTTSKIADIRFSSTKNAYSSVLFNGVGYVPNITEIQRYLDYAHVQGFDVHGLNELGITEGQRIWIGAIDVAAVLRLFSIPAAIFDFTVNSKFDEHKALFEWVWQYFEQRYKYHGKPLVRGYRSSESNNNVNNAKNATNASNNATNAKNEQKNDNVSELNFNQIGSQSKNANYANAGKIEMDEDEDDSDSGSSLENPYQKFQTSRSLMNGNLDVNGNISVNDDYIPIINNNVRVLSDDSGDSDDDERMNANSKKKKITDYLQTLKKNKKEEKNGRRFIPPLYFQHQGHSRTIIGMIYNRKSGIRHLLILDPSVKNGALNLLRNIKNGKIGQLLRSIKQIHALKYQIVCIPAKGLLSENDRNQCKNMQSLNV